MADEADRADAAAAPADPALAVIARLGQLRDRCRPGADLVFLLPQADLIPVQRALHRRGELVVDYSAGRRATWHGAELLGYTGDEPRVLVEVP